MSYWALKNRRLSHSPLAACLVLCFALWLSACGAAAEFADPSSQSILTAQEWRRTVHHNNDLASEIVTWRFYEDGSYDNNITSDFAQTSQGTWVVHSSTRNGGVVVLRDGEDVPAAFLSFAVDGSRLQLGELWYEGANLKPEHNGLPATAKSSATTTVTSPLWTLLTSNDWTLIGEATRIDPEDWVFSPDGSYIANFSESKCVFSGTWSLLDLRDLSGRVRMTVPEEGCDRRGPVGQVMVRELPLHWNGMRLLFYETSYSKAD